jgi:hypothetical protein
LGFKFHGDDRPARAGIEKQVQITPEKQIGVKVSRPDECGVLRRYRCDQGVGEAVCRPQYGRAVARSVSRIEQLMSEAAVLDGELANINGR